MFGSITPLCPSAEVCGLSPLELEFLDELRMNILASPCDGNTNAALPPPLPLLPLLRLPSPLPPRPLFMLVPKLRMDTPKRRLFPVG